MLSLRRKVCAGRRGVALGLGLGGFKVGARWSWSSQKASGGELSGNNKGSPVPQGCSAELLAVAVEILRASAQLVLESSRSVGDGQDRPSVSTTHMAVMSSKR